MEPLAFVEIIGRHGEVLQRHALQRWPARVGRGYDMDVILDDPHVAPVHLSIEPVQENRYLVRDLGSVNGTRLSTNGARSAELNTGPDDMICIGQTQLRIRPLHYAVRAETPLRGGTGLRNIGLFALLGGIMIGMTIWTAYLVTLQQDENPAMIVGALGMAAAVLLWVSAWALVSRIVMGRANFFAHGVIAAAGAIALFVTDIVFDYLGFGLDLRWLDYLGILAGAAMFAYVFYRHLCLASHFSARALAGAAIVVSFILHAGSMAVDYAKDRSASGKQQYRETVKAPAFLLVKGVAPAVFFAESESLKRKVDEAATKDP